MPTALEDRFIRYAREAARNRSRSLMKSSCPEHLLNNFKIAGYTYGFEVLTPRGLDLFLTAEHVGYDPDAKTTALEIAPPTQPCGTCKGEGRVLIGTQQSLSLRGMKALVEGLDGTERDPDPLLREADAPEQVEVLPGWDVTCGECKGAKVVPAELPEYIWKTRQRADAFGFVHDEVTVAQSFADQHDALVSHLADTLGMPASMLDPAGDLRSNAKISNEIMANKRKLQAEVSRTTGIPARIFHNTPYEPFSWTVDELREAGASRDLLAERKAAMLAREYEQRAIDESPGYNAHACADGTTRYTPNAALVERGIVAQQFKVGDRVMSSDGRSGSVSRKLSAGYVAVVWGKSACAMVEKIDTLSAVPKS